MVLLHWLFMSFVQKIFIFICYYKIMSIHKNDNGLTQTRVLYLISLAWEQIVISHNESRFCYAYFSYLFSWLFVEQYISLSNSIFDINNTLDNISISISSWMKHTNNIMIKLSIFQYRFKILLTRLSLVFSGFSFASGSKDLLVLPTSW